MSKQTPVVRQGGSTTVPAPKPAGQKKPKPEGTANADQS